MSMVIDGEKLRKLRHVYRLSCEEMGALMNVSGRFISYVERGDRKLPKERADRLAAKLALDDTKLVRILSLYDEFAKNVKEVLSG